MDVGLDPVARIGSLPWFSGKARAPSSITFLGGVTNRSYRVVAGGEAWVVRIPGSGAQLLIDRAAECRNAAAAAERGLTIADSWFDAETGIKVSRFMESAAPLSAAAVHEPAQRAEVAALLRRLHGSSAVFAAAFSPRLVFARCMALLASKGLQVPGPLGAAAEDYRRCIDLLDEIPERAQRPCHQDLWRENLVRIGGRLLLLDWEHSAPGDPMYDLADLANQADLDPAEERHLLRAYLERSPEPEECARLWFGRVLSLLMWGAWAITRSLIEVVSAEYATAGARRLAAAATLLDSAEAGAHGSAIRSSARR